jgi:hypothetical protein
MLLIVLKGNRGSAVSDDLAALAGEAYVHGFLLVFDLNQVGRIAREGLGSLPKDRRRPRPSTSTLQIATWWSTSSKRKSSDREEES